jgi:hypothetical protein
MAKSKARLRDGSGRDEQSWTTDACTALARTHVEEVATLNVPLILISAVNRRIHLLTLGATCVSE